MAKQDNHGKEVTFMTMRQPHYSKEEFARRGHEIYQSQVRSRVEKDNYGKIVVIDIETGAFEVADDSLTAAKQLLIRFPDAQIFGISINWWFRGEGGRTSH